MPLTRQFSDNSRRKRQPGSRLAHNKKKNKEKEDM
jgi:hypothetical protein